MEALQEVYFGKEPIAPLQRQLSIVRKKVAHSPVTLSTNLDPEILKFNRMVESFFGFHSFSLYIQPNNMPNATMYNIDNFFTEEDKQKMLKSIIASPTGFKYKDAFIELSVIMHINTGFIDMDELTDEELMACVLHEIGHSFFLAVTNPDTDYTTAKKMVRALQTIHDLATDKVKHGKFVTEKMIDNELNKFTNIASSIARKMKELNAKIVKNFMREAMEDNMRWNRVEYTDEKFADTFAAMYGYGQELHSLMGKTDQLLVKKFRGVKTYSRIEELFKMYKLYLKDLIDYSRNKQDEHPEYLARVKTTADYLKREISREGLDPKLKKELLEELNNVYALIEDFKNYPKDQDSIRIFRLYSIKLYEKFGGDRRERDTDNDALFDTIDNKYNALAARKESFEEANEGGVVLYEMHFTDEDLQDETTIDKIKAKKSKEKDVAKYISNILKSSVDAFGVLGGAKYHDNNKIKIPIMIVCGLLREVANSIKDIPDKNYSRNIRKYKSEVHKLRDKARDNIINDPKNSKEYVKVLDNCQMILDKFDAHDQYMRFKTI